MKLRNTVVIITYNQKDLIRRALDSILCQSNFIYEIVISDDCSTDETWEVIQEYKEKYPHIIKPFRNPINLGIFENIESTWTKVTGDIIWYLAGDDEYCNGLFEEANILIEKYNINIINEAFTLYFDYKAIAPNGKETIFRNNLIEQFDPISLKIRQLICNRTTGFSRKVLEKFYPVRKDVGIMADGLIDIQTQLFSDKNYYAPFIGSIYYTSIGISSKTKSESLIKSAILSLEQLKIDIKNLSINDFNWLTYLQLQLSFQLKLSLNSYLSYLKYLILVIKDFYGWTFFKREVIWFMKSTLKLLFKKIYQKWYYK